MLGKEIILLINDLVEGNMLKGKVEVQSSFINLISWDGNDLDITIGNNTYRYMNVEREDILKLISSESPGRYFNSYIKNKYNIK